MAGMPCPSSAGPGPQDCRISANPASRTTPPRPASFVTLIRPDTLDTLGAQTAEDGPPRTTAAKLDGRISEREGAGHEEAGDDQSGG